MRMKAGLSRIGLVAFACCVSLLLAHVQQPAAGEGGIDSVAVIAHSVSTSMKAREIRTQFRWADVPPKKADYVLVVRRSMLFNPLNYSYDCYCELDENADNQLNISGSNYHVYLYRINDDLSVSQVNHTSFEAGD